MTATEELRRLLDERGVKWDVLQGSEGGEMTRWRDSMGRYVTALDDGVVAFFTDFYWGPTPQQAVEATLGRGECHIEAHFGEWYCTGCGVMVGTCDPDSELRVDGNYVEMWNYCPNCGRKVVEQ